MVEELENFFVSSKDTSKALKINKKLCEHTKSLLKDFLTMSIDVFAWKHMNILGVDPNVAYHALKFNQKIKPKI